MMKKKDLLDKVNKCHKCPDMKDPVLSDKNGDWNAKIMFVAEAPGRLGCARTHIPIYGDATGKRFEDFLDKEADANKGWQNKGIFVTNAVLCNPLDAKGNNKKPSPEHCANCKPYLLETIQIVNPQVIVCLGKVAAEILGEEEPLRDKNGNKIAKIKISAMVGKEFFWNDKTVYVFYHPSPRNRRFDDLQKKCYKELMCR